MEITYLRKFRKFRFSGSFTNRIWKSSGNRVWKSRMQIAYGNRVIKAYTGASFANFDSADLLEIAHGNRVWKSCMEAAYGSRLCRRKLLKFRFRGACGHRVWKSHMGIAYVGATSANCDSADLAEIFYESRICKSHMSAQVSQTSIRGIMRQCAQNAREREQWRS